MGGEKTAVKSVTAVTRLLIAKQLASINLCRTRDGARTLKTPGRLSPIGSFRSEFASN
jgi:hypothetical protein